MGYIYLLQVYPNNKDKIYKLGRTNRDFVCRYKEYKHASIELVLKCPQVRKCEEAEKDLLKQFRGSYVERRDLGNEYFEGDVEDMKKTIMEYILAIPVTVPFLPLVKSNEQPMEVEEYTYRHKVRVKRQKCE